MPAAASTRFRPPNASIEEEYLSYASPIYPGLMLVAREPTTGLSDVELNDLNEFLKAKGWPKGVEYMKLPIEDTSTFELLPFLEETCTFIETALAPRYEQMLSNEDSSSTPSRSATAPNVTSTASNPPPTPTPPILPPGPLPDDPPVPPPTLPTVLVHCQLGVSRSASVVAAHLIRMWHRCANPHGRQGGASSSKSSSGSLLPALPPRLTSMLLLPPTPHDHQPPQLTLLAIKILNRRRNIIYPNDGFRNQLATWERMGGTWGAGPGVVYEAATWIGRTSRGLNKAVDGWIEAVTGVKNRPVFKLPKKVVRYREELAQERSEVEVETGHAVEAEEQASENIVIESVRLESEGGASVAEKRTGNGDDASHGLTSENKK
ncbi:hypothetical protein HDU93_008667 [Gonapodya sp. JEL0774]|nr:hypothetical protein HDU93_008667 [Gonapodya sp. JEL0774]